jgi:hypothetical protein
MPYHGGGAYLFLDLIHAKFIFGISGGGGKWETRNNISARELPDMRRSMVNLGAFWKTPSTTESAGDVKFFPLAGLEYEMSYGELETSRGRSYIGGGNLSALWLKLGCGLNVGFSEGVYWRTEALYGWRTANEFERNSAKNYDRGSTRLGHGLTLKTGLGFNF